MEMDPASRPLVDAVFEHLVLPPKLPSKPDEEPLPLNLELTSRLLDACRYLRSQEAEGIWSVVEASLLLTQKVIQNPISRGALLEAFSAIAQKNADGWLVLHVVQQNAIILIHKSKETEEVVFEAFEASAPAPVVLETNHALQWNFPSRSVAISLSDFSENSFQDGLSEFLEQASEIAFDRFAARASKGGKLVVESRDNPSPALITEMLLSFVEAYGRAFPVLSVQKRVRDDVVLGSAEIPWRRSPYWLGIRVAVQRVLLTYCDDCLESSRILYKFLMCIVLARFLADSCTSLHPEKVMMLQAKLCRRLSKLESLKNEASTSLTKLLDREFSRTRGYFESTLAEATRATNAIWDNYKRKASRFIPRLPRRASQSDIVLRLPNSGKTLEDLLKLSFVAIQSPSQIATPPLVEGTVTQVNNFAMNYIKLQCCASKAMSSLHCSQTSSEEKCTKISKALMKYMNEVGSTYVDNAVLMSSYLLDLFELWTAMDTLATFICPLLRKYHPVFVPEALDMLCLTRREDLERLCSVQRHISNRIKSHCKTHGTIFSNDRTKTSFPVQYIGQNQSSELISLRQEIETASTRSEKLKKAELLNLMNEYNRLSVEMQKGICCCTRLPNGTLDVRGCMRCWQARCRKRLKIGIHETFLPGDKSDKAAVLLELKMPEYLSVYRDATWRLRMLGKNIFHRSDPAILLEDFSPLKEFRCRQGTTLVTMASRIKSFSQTHYRELKLPKSDHDILFPFGPQFTYYDTENSVWTDECCDAPWYHHLLGTWLPKDIPDPFATACTYLSHKEDPSSYEIAARLDTCPQDMSVHEFEALQRAIFGVHRRWIVLVCELGSMNLSLSSEITLSLFKRMTFQAGPNYTDFQENYLRKIHIVFNNVEFCERLEQQITLRLKALESGRRDLACMSILITLSLRLYHLCPNAFKSKIAMTFCKIRRLVCLWISQLRDEVRSTEDGEAARKAASSAFHASLLCRQTFEAFSFPEDEAHFGEEEALQYFRASIALSENLTMNLDEIDQNLRRLLAEDMNRVYAMSDKISEWTVAYSSSLECAINETWTDIGGFQSRSFMEWKLFKDGPWFTSRTVNTSRIASQSIHFHIFQGHLLIDNKPLGRLPLEIQEDKNVIELFQKQHLLTRSSGLPGMEYQIVNSSHNHEIHVGFRQGQVIIRAKFRNRLLEHIPRENFIGSSMSDLPSGLIFDCVHWLNLETGDLEIRRKPSIWTSKPGNWVLNVRDRIAMRNRNFQMNKEGTCLVEPQSEIGQHIMQIFEGFELPGMITIFQPQKFSGRLSVEIKRLEMCFFVNNKGLLQSDQLHSEIDPFQNIGALHGLHSKLIIRNTLNPKRRAVLVPIGTKSLFCTQRPHVSAKIPNEGSYALFTVDPVLGRLNCAPEPVLFYLRALIHAMTSFPLPDELTGRTGTEEAYQCLTSAQSQPWKPLGTLAKKILALIIDLSPKRQFYPTSKRLYQNVTWASGLTATIQQEQLAILAGDILRQSQALHMPEGTTDSPVDGVVSYPSLHHLALRGIVRRQIYERNKSEHDYELLSRGAESTHYVPRGSQPQSKESVQVYQVIRALRQKSPGIPELRDLGSIFQSWGSIHGFKNTSNTLDIQRGLNADLPQVFGDLVQTLRSEVGVTHVYSQLNLGLLAFREQVDMEIIAWLVAIANHSILREIEPPDSESFTDFHLFQKLNASRFKALVMKTQKSYEAFKSAHHQRRKSGLSKRPGKVDYDFDLEQEADKLSLRLKDAWPDVPLSIFEFLEVCSELELKYTVPTETWGCLELELQRLHQNHRLSYFALSLKNAARKLRDECGEDVLDADNKIWTSMPKNLISPASGASSIFSNSYQVPALSTIFSNNLLSKAKEIGFKDLQAIETSDDKPSCCSRNYDIVTRLAYLPKEVSLLRDIARPLTVSENLIKRQYGEDLVESITALAWDLEKAQAQSETLSISPDELNHQIATTKGKLDEKLSCIRNVLSGLHTCSFWLKAGYLWPCDSLTTILQQLRLRSYMKLGLEQKTALVECGILVTRLQHLLRMHDAQCCGDQKRLLEEKEHEGHTNWAPIDYPEWLLLEIDNNILVRPVQVEVAQAIISPLSQKNSVLQMNMGMGKTSVVMPMAVLVLADTARLCRVVVPKALLLQTAQVLQSRIGGLIGRQVRHIPFTRRSPADADTLGRYWNIHKEMQASGGVMICLPAHVLSFKLSGLQRLADGQQQVGSQMVEMQNWLTMNCRDILDESDLTLSVQTQLIYPSGDLTVVDGHPHRWLVVEELLRLVEQHASYLQRRFQSQVVVVQRHQSYPIIYFLSTAPEDALNELLIDDICNGRLLQLRTHGSGAQDARHVIRQIINGSQVSTAMWDSAIKSLKDVVFGPKTLYLLRGLISERILLLCLKKKWNIQYGLHPQRQPIAVPFEAKGIPSQAAEYGHPDTAIILTCLAFYQSGLTKEQIKQGLEWIVQSEDPAAHYDRWTCSCASLPVSLQCWNSVDPQNELQVDTLWEYLKFNRTVINHHMNKFVFPRYAKQFSVKLQASGWDIPLLRADEKVKHASLTTGFSGTNDNKRMLPHCIKQDDLPNLLCTNAKVLCHLLESRNARYHLAENKGVRLTEIETLKFLFEKRIRVLIDAGAHILEMENHAVASAWLGIDREVEGAVYLDNESHIMVRSRFQKNPMPLLASPYANNLEKCVVYIDEGHTRGTDIKLPIDAKGIVTLGLGQTKDQTVQAAMRLRQLGTTQSVAFLAPPEVHHSILDVRREHTQVQSTPSEISSVDVVRWLLEQSCKGNEQLMSLHFSQCQDFCRRMDSLWKYPGFATNKKELRQILKVIRQPEQQTLQLQYGPKKLQVPQDEHLQLAFPQLRTFVQNVAQMARYGQKSYSSALMEVEQEREVVFEVEQVREKQSNNKHSALTFPGLDPAITQFLKTGQLEPTSADKDQFLQAFKYVGMTKLGRKFDVKGTSSRLYVSREFCRTIESDRLYVKYEVLRPVHWILWSPTTETGLIIIPEEADLVVPELRGMGTPRVWLLSYSAPVTKSMQIFNSLTFLTVPAWPRNGTVPPWLVIEIGFLSGRLYFEYAEYEALLAWLGVDEGAKQLWPECSGLEVEEPLALLQEWVAYRRQTEDFLYTPIGFVCQHKPLHEEHFFFKSHTPSSLSAASMSPKAVFSEGPEDDDDSDDGDWGENCETELAACRE